ncbi:putative WEB family protein At1g65010, chloroplastic [Macadamia integrifolia]|uniref:putative WEB family protein At1g65010, chloroplastic n=1 Tax=Macadamia integrifolia TaxID=60698 RepID=UPI001C4FF61E|nr:putative WEB family protein At1g65010, chloroplastic [Macadamia integrifolia]
MGLLKLSLVLLLLELQRWRWVSETKLNSSFSRISEIGSVYTFICIKATPASVPIGKGLFAVLELNSLESNHPSSFILPKGSEMQAQFGLLEEEIKEVKQQESSRPRIGIRGMKKVAGEENLRLSEGLLAQAWYLELEAVKKQHAMDVDALSSARQELERVRQELKVALERKDAAVKMAEDVKNVAEANARWVQELSAELESVKESLANSREQLEIKDTNLKALRIELEKPNYLAVELEKKEESLMKLKEDLTNTKDSESKAKMKLQMVEDERDKAKESESKMLILLTLQTKQLEQTKILLEESKLEITCLNEKVEYLTRSAEKRSTENTLSQSKAQALAQEFNLLRTELKLATDTEEKYRKAMDDLALALTEVSMEANEAKGKLISSQSERENAMREVEHLKKITKSTEEKYLELLSEARNEINQIKDEAERLRSEAEESNLAWNRKELGFINCIKGTEEEFHEMKQENSRLLESIEEAEHMTKVSKGETNKLRDILKQALNEANVAKEVAEIARAENYQLKDSLEEKDITSLDLSRENEHLRINGAVALENIKNLKRLLSAATAATTTGTAAQPISKESEECKTLAKVVNVDTEDLKVSNGYKEADGNHMDHDVNKQRKKRAILKKFGHLLKNNLS